MPNDSLQQIVESADRSYAARAEIENVRQSVESLRHAASALDDYEVAWRLSRALFFLGQESAAASELTAGADWSTRRIAQQLHREAANAGRRAAHLQPDRVEGHFWAGVNLALLAAHEFRFIGAAHALRAKRALQSAIAIDAAYHAGGPWRVLARLQHKLPRWLGGGATRARASFERAIRLAPANTVTRIYFAELWFDTGEPTRARMELEQILSIAFDPNWAFEIRRDQLLAKELLASQRGLER